MNEEKVEPKIKTTGKGVQHENSQMNNRGHFNWNKIRFQCCLIFYFRIVKLLFVSYE